MKIVRLIKPALLLYELLRIIILAAVLLVSSNGNDILGQLVYIAPSALFTIMALFIWLDQERYSAYLPLFAAGKCVVICTSLVWSILSGQATMTGRLTGSEFTLTGFDLLSVAAVLAVYKDNVTAAKTAVITAAGGTKKPSEIKADNDTEEKICE